MRSVGPILAPQTSIWHTTKTIHVDNFPHFKWRITLYYLFTSTYVTFRYIVDTFGYLDETYITQIKFRICIMQYHCVICNDAKWMDTNSVGFLQMRRYHADFQITLQRSIYRWKQHVEPVEMLYSAERDAYTNSYYIR